MDYGLVVLGFLHIVFVAFWVGSVVFMTEILEPKLRALGPDSQQPGMSSVARAAGPC